MYFVLIFISLSDSFIQNNLRVRPFFQLKSKSELDLYRAHYFASLDSIYSLPNLTLMTRACDKDRIVSFTPKHALITSLFHWYFFLLF